MKRLLTGTIFFCSVLLCALIPDILSAATEKECSTDDLHFGMSTALTGPIARLGLLMQMGVEAAFNEQNSKGGVQGRDLCLTTLDDGYEPERTVPNIRHLIQQEKVLALIGNVGTPTAVVAAPICKQMRTLLFGAYTGAGILRKIPPDRYIINYRASYAEETEAMVNGLIVHGGLKPEEIAFFTQRDAFGDAGFSSGMKALQGHGLKDERLIVHARYERNTYAVENGLATILLASPAPKAIIMVGAYGPCSKFVQLARKNGVQSKLLAVSFVSAALVAEELKADGKGIIITEVVPHYLSDLPVVRDFRQALQLLPNQREHVSFGALEGYIVARILIKALKTLKEEPSRENIINALQDLGRFDLGRGFTLHLSKSKHQASHRVWPAVIYNGQVMPFKWKDLAEE